MEITIIVLISSIVIYFLLRLQYKTQHIVRLRKTRTILITTAIIALAQTTFVDTLHLISRSLWFLIVPAYVFFVVIETTNLPKSIEIKKDKKESLITRLSQINQKLLIGPGIISLSLIMALFIIFFYQSPQNCVYKEFNKIKKDIYLFRLDDSKFDITDNKQLTSAIKTVVESNKNISSTSNSFEDYVALRAILDKCKIAYINK